MGSTDKDVRELKKLADDTGIRISSVGGIVSFSIYPLTATDAQVAQKSMDAVKKMLDFARILGADTILVIPGMLGMAIGKSLGVRIVEKIDVKLMKKLIYGFLGLSGLITFLSNI